MDFINPFTVPKTIDGWRKLDNICYNSDWYDYYVKQRQEYGNIEISHLNEAGNEDLVKANSYFLAVVNTSFNGFNTMVNTTIESSICQVTMNSVFPSVTQRGCSEAGRMIYYNAYNKFMLVTDKAKLARLNYITNELDTVAGETIKDFAKRLKVEADTMNMMEGTVAITETQLKTILMKVVEKNFQNLKYWTAFHTLTESKPDYTFDDLVESYDKVWVQEQGFVVNSEGSLYSVTSNKNGKSAKSTTNNYNNHFESLNFTTGGNHDKRTKKELRKDSSGKLICFNFARDRKCKFGDKCKYSHKPEAAEKVMNAFSMEEINSTANEQLFQVGYSRGRRKERFQSKTRNRSWRKNFKSNFKRKFPSRFRKYQNKHSAYFSTPDSKNNSRSSKNSNTFQGAISEYKKQIESKSANVIESLEDQEINAVFFSDSDESSDISYSSDDDDDSDSSEVAVSESSATVNLAEVTNNNGRINTINEESDDSTSTVPYNSDN